MSDPAHSLTHNYPLATAYSIGAYFFIAMATILFKSMVAEYPVFQVFFIEYAVCLPFFVVLAMMKGGFHKLRTHYPFKQSLRGVSQLCCAALWFYGLVYLPLSTHTILTYSAPFIIVILARIVLKERCPPVAWMIIILGFIGVSFAAGPQWDGHILAIVAVLSCGFFWAVNVVLTRLMPKDDIVTFPFYTSLFCLIGGGIWVFYHGLTPMTRHDYMFVAAAAASSFVGTQLLFASYRHAPLHFTSPFEYTQLLWVVVIGYMIWGDVPSLAQGVGVALIAVSSISLTLLQEKVGKTKPA